MPNIIDNIITGLTVLRGHCPEDVMVTENADRLCVWSPSDRPIHVLPEQERELNLAGWYRNSEGWMKQLG